MSMKNCNNSQHKQCPKQDGHEECVFNRGSFTVKLIALASVLGTNQSINERNDGLLCIAQGSSGAANDVAKNL